jgi:hypothetical protein
MDDHKPAVFITLAALGLGLTLFVPGPVAVRAVAPPLITVSGTVTGPGGAPVAGAAVDAWVADDVGSATITDATGFYEVTLPGGDVAMAVWPPLASRLSARSVHIGYRDTSFTHDFEVVAGHLLAGTVLMPDGAPPDMELWVDLEPMSFSLPPEEWLGAPTAPGSGEFQVVAPPGAYDLAVFGPAPTYPARQSVDLSSGDVTGIVLTLSSEPTSPFPYDPPDASRITIGTAADALNQVAVTGASGATLPVAHVLLVNLSSFHQAHTISEADGSFSARIYAPPGSALMVKHGPASPRWNDLDVGVAEQLNPFPGTIIHVPPTHGGAALQLPFAAVGAVDFMVDDPRETLNYVSSAWAITGTLGPVAVDGEWTRVLTGTYDGETVPGLYLGGLNWTHPALGDLDDDGDLDLLVGEEFGHLVLYRNEGTPAAPDWQLETADYAGVDTGEWAYPALAEVTGDGALDLFVGRGDGTVSVYYNDGTPAEPLWPTAPDVTLSVGANPAPALDDLNGDTSTGLSAGGLLDLLVGYWDEAEGGQLAHFANTGTVTDPVWTRQTDHYAGITEMQGEGVQPAFLDLDGDTDRDLLIGLCGRLIWYERGGSALSPTWARHDEDPIGYGGGSCANSPAVGDWDGDGDPDLAVGEHLGTLRFFRQGSASTWTEQQIPYPFDLAGDSAPALADWDDDGDPDLLIGQLHGQVHAHTNQGSAASPDWRPDGVLLTLPWTNHPHAFPTFADIDGDDDYDLFVGEGGWQGDDAGGNIYYYRNDGTPGAPEWSLITDNWLGLDVGGWSTPAFADVDADDDLDLFVGDSAGTLTFVENIGTSTAPAWAAPVQPYAGLQFGAYAAPAFFDLDQDGDLDMLVGQEDGSLAYVRNVGAPHSPAWEFVISAYRGIDVGTNAVPAAADLDGDAQPDLLIGEGSGGLNLYRYMGPGTPPTDEYRPGDPVRIDGRLRIHGPAISATTDLDALAVHAYPGLIKLFDEAGRPLAATNYFMSTVLTPSGFPIQRPDRSTIPWPGAEIELGDLSYLGGHAVGADLRTMGALPANLEPGVYRPVIWFDIFGVPRDETTWLAANVTRDTFYPNEAALAPITVGTVAPPRLIWRLLSDDYVQGTRGSTAREDQATFDLASQIVSQGAPYHVPPVDLRTGQPITYRLEPFLPMISFTDRRMPTPPLIPFDLPGGQLCVVMQKPDGGRADLGCEPFTQSFNRTPTTRGGMDLNGGTVQMDDVYSLQAASNRFRVTFDDYGHHVVTMTGVVSDVWGNGYTGGGTYDVWAAHQLDIDPGVLPGTPLAVGDAFNPTMQLYPRVPADVALTITLYPDSDPAQAITHTISGRANDYGTFSPSDPARRGSAGPLEATWDPPITMTAPGEYRVDLTALYTDTDGALSVGAMCWGGVVMTPPNQADLVARGRRGLDSLEHIPSHWFISSELDIPEGAISHTFNPYYEGDILWSRMSDGPYGGDSLLLGASVWDGVGTIESAVRARFDREQPPLASPGSPAERFAMGEIPLFSSTLSDRPVHFVLGRIGETVPDDVDQIAYSYRSSQRPGVRVREVVAEDAQTGGYWRLDTLYDDQLGVGVLGDQPNDFKFQYVGAVYRDLASGHSEYAGQGTGWIFIPDDDPVGSRVMPPFAGPGNGGWTTQGGPILTLKGKDVHIFILPTGVRPGAVLEVGDTFRFAGHIMPTLDSQVAVTVTAPGGGQHVVAGRANSVGYFYDPDDDFVVDQPGLWAVDVRVWHDGQIGSGGQTVPPYPSGDVLGSDEGRYWFYVVPQGSPRLDVSAPKPGFLSFDQEVTPITISGSVPAGLSGATLDYTIAMAGFILEQGQVVPSGRTYHFTFDAVALHEDFPNLDLVGRDDPGPGLADTFAIGLLLRGQRGDSTVYRANTVTIQGEQVFVGEGATDVSYDVYLPLVMRSG